ncbi:LysR family transcriptional regulator [Lysinibacillus sphaericus]|uniref:LysR family transcriptional regulator n=1 Tax=Lysinibacillus sphaericus TaxID=1421 RepID=UPI0018CE2446|nr:LysR family transcriptional regulator [Lysinibacillus sphaericus]MBG9758084.1 LysR family transcriptional regulator [Lysinibacillus sphaericus]QTB15148.1 LysR family transcriptional regulator [Lysinibacillus sphaericus]
MEWQQLEYFVTVAKLEHMTRAAEALAISQPALSRSISKLEEELGVPLFDRQGRSIMLNRYGELFLYRVQRMRKEYEKAVLELQELNNPELGDVSLGFLHTLGTSIVPDLIRAFRQKHPHIRFHFTQNYSHSQLKQLLAGELDLCLLAAIDTEPPVSWKELWRDELFIMVPIDHPLAHRKSIKMKELEHESFVLMKKGYALRRSADRLLHAAGIKPKISYEGDEVSTIAGFVGAGLGVSLLPDDEDLNPKKIVKIHVEDMVCERIIGMAWIDNRYLSPSARQFQQFVFDFYEKKMSPPSQES